MGSKNGGERAGRKGGGERGLLAGGGAGYRLHVTRGNMRDFDRS